MADVKTKEASARATPFPIAPIDCDVHATVPNMRVLVPYLDDYWREAVLVRGIDLISMTLSGQPPFAPPFVRPDWRPQSGLPGSDLDALRTQLLDPFGTRYAILNCLYGAQALHSEDMAAALCGAVNDWLAHEWLDRDPRLRASLTLPVQSPAHSVEEMEKHAGDERFVQALMPVMGELTPGRRYYWPIYEAAERLGFAVGFHAGSSYRHAPTSAGWPSYVMEDYVAQSAAFEQLLLSLVTEGVFAKFPTLKVVCLESGFTWLPAFLWRANKTWKGTRAETPWVKEPPADIIRQHVRFTIQPLDAPPEPGALERVVEQLGSERMLLFSTDYPHWQFDGMDALPKALQPLANKVLHDNALQTYVRLKNTEIRP
jgi:predicted TIM-barrel fold metal-dependent hydrolase